MRTVKILLLALILLVIVVLSLANRELVTLNLLPEGMATLMPVSVQVPLFLVSLLSILVGMILGYLLEWLREHKHRRRASEHAREAARLSREMHELRTSTGKPEDEVLALISR
ncbi:LapA family protein [Amaricoccus solimangrovi]|uniref:LapA family protein n=1 Tax=Amaricoccus solimangrovi TaxID=2589815 RepID=A0A501WPF2_9RHOB|nr:LapA family protein [Amaricoccus solimangrovi]TPE50220.1 LapA family protein [Amaricoccus solimangrovi]